MNEILNAQIKTTQLGREDHRIFTFGLTLAIQGGLGVTVGGYAMDRYDKLKDSRVGTAYGMNLVIRILDVVGVDTWEELKGKYIRVEVPFNSGPVTKIGNLMEDKWVDFSAFGGEE